MIGIVQFVDQAHQGGMLTANVASSGTVLTVDSTSEFSELGGSLILNDVTYTYTSITDTTITVSSGLTGAAITGDSVISLDAEGNDEVQWVAHCDLQDGGDVVPVLIPTFLIGDFTEGDANAGQMIEVEIADNGDYQVAYRVMQQRLLDGSILDPTTLPTDSLPPASSPTPIAIGGVGALFVRWTPIVNNDPVLYEVHISTTDGFTPSSGTLSVTTAGASTTIRQMPDGSSLNYATTYYVVIIAKDADGAAPASAEASTTMMPVTSADVSAEYVYAGNILADQITGGTISSDLLLSSLIKTAASGSRVEIGPSGIAIFDSTGAPVIVLPSAISSTNPASFQGDVETNALTVNGGLSVTGTTNEVAESGAVTLQAGLTAPAATSTVTIDYSTVTLAVPSTYATDTNHGLQYVATGTPSGSPEWWVATASADGLASNLLRFTTAGAYLGVRSSTLLSFAGSGGSGSDTVYGRVEVTGSGTTWYFDQRPNGDWYLNKAGTSTSLFYASGINTPIMTTDGTDLIALYRTAGGSVQVDHRNASTGAQTSSTLLPPGPSGNVGGYYSGSADFGVTRHVIGSKSSGEGVFTWDTTPARQSTTDFPARGSVRGLAWDGSNFWTLSGFVLTKYESGTRWTTESSTWWAGYTWRNTTTSKETNLAAVKSFTMTKRARLTLASGTIPSQANTVGFYLGRGTTVTNPTGYFRQTSTTGATSLILTSPVFTGTNPPSSNTFTSGTAGKLAAAGNGFSIDGQSNGSVGTGTFRDSVDARVTAAFGAWTSYTPSWTSSGTAPSVGNGTLTGAYVQVGKTVHFRLNLTLGSTTSLGTGGFFFSLPVASIITRGAIGRAHIRNGTSDYGRSAILNGTSSAVQLQGEDGTRYSATTIALASSDQINVSGTYEAA